MGSDREFGQEQSPPEVFKRLSDNYSDIEKMKLFNTWKEYNSIKLRSGSSQIAIDYLYRENLDYFTIVGLELFNKEYIEEFKA